MRFVTCLLSVFVVHSWSKNCATICLFSMSCVNRLFPFPPPFTDINLASPNPPRQFVDALSIKQTPPTTDSFIFSGRSYHIAGTFAILKFATPPSYCQQHLHKASVLGQIFKLYIFYYFLLPALPFVLPCLSRRIKDQHQSSDNTPFRYTHSGYIDTTNFPSHTPLKKKT